jgi:hypothetical protein
MKSTCNTREWIGLERVGWAKEPQVAYNTTIQGPYFSYGIYVNCSMPSKNPMKFDRFEHTGSFTFHLQLRSIPKRCIPIPTRGNRRKRRSPRWLGFSSPPPVLPLVRPPPMASQALEVWRTSASRRREGHVSCFRVFLCLLPDGEVVAT